MAHHKRKGPKSTRAGCLLCKPHKRQGVKTKTAAQMRQQSAASQALKEAEVARHLQRNLRLT